jgi:hypothetical protein
MATIGLFFTPVSMVVEKITTNLTIEEMESRKYDALDRRFKSPTLQGSFTEDEIVKIECFPDIENDECDLYLEL